jgi:heavy metal sensor kinase
MPRMTIGWRLTLWYGAVLAVSLVGLGALVFVTFSRNLMAEIDRALDEELAEIEMEVTAAPDAAARDRQLHKYFGEHEFYEIQVARPGGEILFRSETAAAHPFVVPAIDALAGTEMKESVTQSDGASFRLGSRVVTGCDGPVVIQTADSLALYHRERRQLLAVMFTTVPVVLLLAGAGGFWVSRRALAPVDRMTATALEISASRLDRRVETPVSNDEMGRLALAFNAMIERLQQSFSEMQRFTADAAHELRTPLAVLRSEAEVALRAPRSVERYQEVLVSQLEEIERLSRLADQLLFLCREDAGPPSTKAPVRVDAVLEAVGSQMQGAAEARGLTLAVQDPPVCTVEIDADRLRRLFVNLLDNAIKFTPAGGTVTVTGRRENGAVEITVADSGIGVAANHAPRLFQRFYRVDAARSGREGAGLGLAICQSIVQGHQGTIRLESEPGRGTQVRVRLPVSCSAGE